MEPKGKVVIVTGASSGIGEATAREFGREGAKVVLAARRVDRLEALATEIAAMGSGAETLVVAADLSKLEDIQSLVKQTLDKFGRIDVLVNNAGFGRLDWLENLDPRDGGRADHASGFARDDQTTRWRDHQHVFDGRVGRDADVYNLRGQQTCGAWIFRGLAARGETLGY